MLCAKAGAVRSGEDPLWSADIEALFRQQTITASTTASALTLDYLTRLMDDSEKAVTKDPETVSANSARPSFTRDQVREVHRVLQLTNNINPQRIADILKEGGFTGVPE